MTLEDFESIQRWIRDVGSLRRAVISGRRKSHHPKFARVDIRPVRIKEQVMLQFVFHDGTKDLTKNFLPAEANVKELLEDGYANLLIERVEETLTIRITKQGELQIHRAESEKITDIDIDHDHKKRRALPIDDEIFHALGIATREGELIPRQSDKYRQVDDFLKIVESILDQLSDREISVADLGCGNAYLTFAVYKYLALKGKGVNVFGVENKEESRARNSKISKDLGISNQVKFVVINIDDIPETQTSLVLPTITI